MNVQMLEKHQLFQAGQQVTIGRNDAGVRPGTLGVVLRQNAESGNWIVAVGPDKRPVAFTADSLSLPKEPTPLATAPAERKRGMSDEARARMREAARKRAADQRDAKELAARDPMAAAAKALRGVLGDAAASGAEMAALKRLIDLIESLEAA